MTVSSVQQNYETKCQDMFYKSTKTFRKNYPQATVLEWDKLKSYFVKHVKNEFCSLSRIFCGMV